jgi:hypothetical protein
MLETLQSLLVTKVVFTSVIYLCISLRSHTGDWNTNVTSRVVVFWVGLRVV